MGLLHTNLLIALTRPHKRTGEVAALDLSWVVVVEVCAGISDHA